MNIDRRTVGDVMIFSVTGDITMNADGTTGVSDKVRSALQDGYSNLLLDLGQVRYVDSSGLGDLVEAYTSAKNRGGTLKLLNVGKRVNDLLVITRLLTVFECFDRESDALASFSAPAAPAPDAK